MNGVRLGELTSRPSSHGAPGVPGRRLGVLVAQTKALAMAVRGQRTIYRWSKPAGWRR